MYAFIRNKERLSITGKLEMRNRHVWILGLYKLNWPANGSFKYVDIFFFLFFFLVGVGGGGGERRNVKGERGSWGRGRRGYIVLCIH